MRQTIDEEKIRARAYEIWEREGRQDGREEENWHRAYFELMREAGEPAAQTLPPKSQKGGSRSATVSAAKAKPEPAKARPAAGLDAATPIKRVSKKAKS